MGLALSLGDPVGALSVEEAYVGGGEGSLANPRTHTQVRLVNSWWIHILKTDHILHLLKTDREKKSREM
jgi:hypothetical protein